MAATDASKDGKEVKDEKKEDTKTTKDKKAQENAEQDLVVETHLNLFKNV